MALTQNFGPVDRVIKFRGMMRIVALSTHGDRNLPGNERRVSASIRMSGARSMTHLTLHVGQSVDLTKNAPTGRLPASDVT